MAARAEAGSEHLHFIRLTTDDGLSDSTVRAFWQDSKGFLWIGTADGLNRYDGYSFKVFLPDAGDPGSLVGGYVWDILEDRDGVLWVGTNAGLNRYVSETGSFIHYGSDSEDESTLASLHVAALLEDRRGDLWVGTLQGLHRMDRASGTFVRYMQAPDISVFLPQDDIQAIFEDSLDRLWLGTEGGLVLFDRESGDFVTYRNDPADETSLSDDLVQDIGEDSYGNLWVATVDGLNRMRLRKPGSFVRYRHAVTGSSRIRVSNVQTVLEDSHRQLWVGTDGGGLAYYDRARDRFVHYVHDAGDLFSISNDVIFALFEDRNENLWIGNFGGGVNFLDRASTAFRFYTHKQDDPGSLNHKSVLSILEDSAGEIWIGTEGGIARFDPANGRSIRFRHDPLDPTSLSADPALSLLVDRDGTLWVGTFYGGLNRFDRQRRIFARIQLDEAQGGRPGRTDVWSLEEDRDGLLWVGTSGGLYRYDRATGASTLFNHEPGNPTSLLNDVIWDIHEDRRGRLWVATHYGLGLFHPDRQAFENFQDDVGEASLLNHNRINWIHEDSEGRLWLSTHGGAKLFDPERRTFTTLGRDAGLSSDVVFSAVSDDQGYIWLGTNRGLSRYDPRQEAFLNLGRADGLQGGQFNRGVALRSRSGELFFGGINGLNIFDPSEVGPNLLPPPVVLTGLKIFNAEAAVGEGAPMRKQIGEAELVTLRHDQSVVTFEFASLNYRNPAQNRYAYMLEGFDDDWVHAGRKRAATYTNLDPGTYTFRVKGSNNSGVWNEQGAALRLVVTPPFWATWWFRLVTLLSLIALALAIHRLRVRSIMRHNVALQAEIEQRQAAEAARARLVTELEEKNVLLEQQNAELERFAYTVSHDLKSPLVTIRGYLGLLEIDIDKRDDEAIGRDLMRIGAASDTMASLLDDVLDLSRIGRVANPSEEVSLTDLAQEATRLLGVEIERLGVEVQVDPQMPVVYGDRSRLLAVFQNLLANAVQFMAEQVRPRVSIGGSVEDGRVVCFVRDNGIGVEPRYQDKIFGLFEQLDPAMGGSGVGLALVKRIVEVHGGRVWVESKGRGMGSTFWFTLAAVPPALDAPSPPSTGGRG